MTAYVGIKKMIGLKEGETLWMSAGAGAVGSAGIQFAKAMGAKVHRHRGRR
jgi:NADPH-dependent curcumin reductase CurA